MTTFENGSHIRRNTCHCFSARRHLLIPDHAEHVEWREVIDVQTVSVSHFSAGLAAYSNMHPIHGIESNIGMAPSSRTPLFVL